MTLKPRPVFIFGVARSGTNVLARAIDAHPAAAVALDPLMPLFKAWRNAVALRLADRLVSPFDLIKPFQDYYFDADGPLLLDAMLTADFAIPISADQALRRAVRDRALLESPTLAESFRVWHGSTVLELMCSAFRLIADAQRASGKSRLAVVGIKEVWTPEFARPLAQALPDARFVIIHRDPRAVVASLIALMQADPSQAAHTVSYMRHWRKHVAVAHHLAADPVLADRLMTVRFEDLVSRPKPVMTAVCDFLDVPMNAAMLMPGRNDEWRGNSSFGLMGPGIDAAASTRWRHRLGSDAVATVEYHCAPEMKLAGYDPARDVGILTDAIRKWVSEADRHPGKWRSDSGDVAADLAWEERRWQLLTGKKAKPGEIRRCFLFENFLMTLAVDADRPRQSGTGMAR